MITFRQTSMNRGGWTTGVPLNTELVAGCSHGTMPAHMCVCGPSGRTPGTHTHTHYSLCQRAICFTIFSHKRNFTSSYCCQFLHCPILKLPPTAVMYPIQTRAACFENVQGRVVVVGGGGSNSKTQRGHRNNTQSQSGSHGDKCGSVQ